MATSGSRTVNFCSRGGSNRYYLKWTWDATQSVSANTSTVTVKLYIGSYGNGYGINSTASKSGYITIDGTKYTFTNTCRISSGGSKLLATKSKTITHNSDGTKSFTIAAAFNPAVTISGTYQGNVPMSSTSYTLTQIPRQSTFSSTAGWKFPNNKTISISRKSSSFTHTVQVYVAGSKVKEWIKTKSTSFSTSFTDKEQKDILSLIGTDLTASCEMRLYTYSESTQIGSSYKSITGTVTAYGRSKTTFTSSFNIGDTISGKITENHSDYTHKVVLCDSGGTAKFTMLDTSSTELSWSYTPSASTLYALTPNSNSYTGKIRIYTYYKGVQITSGYEQANITWKVTNSNPTFTPTLSYKDNNSTTSGVTGSNQYIVQNKSKLIVTCAVTTSTLAAENSATIKTVQCTVAGKTLSKTYSSSTTSYTFDFGVVNASSNQSAVVKAIDSRGNSTSKSLTIKFLPYTAPKIIATVERANRFSTTVNIGVKGSFSPLTVNGSSTNSISSASYTKKIDGGTASSAISLTVSNSTSTYSTTNTTFTLAETSIATVVVTVKDELSGTASASIDVPTGQPIMFIDADNGAVAFNALPAYKSTAHFGLKLDVARNQYWGSGKASYGLNMGNSDLVHINSLVFGDVCNNLGEGLRFPNTTYTWNTDYGHTNPSTALPASPTASDYKACYGDYTTVFFRNQELWVDGGKFIEFGNSQIGTNNRAYNNLTFFGNSYVFQTYDVDVATDKGFILDSADGYRMHFDGNEVIAEKDGAYSPWYINTSNAQFQNGVVTINGGLLYPNKGISVPQDIGSKFGHVKIINNTISNDANGNILYLLVHNSDDTATHSLRIGYDATSSPAYIQSPATYSRTVTYAANMYITASGVYSRSTSSAKAKLDITPAFDSIDDYKKILNIEPVKWFDKNAMEATADAMTAEYNGEEIEQVDSFNLNRVYGCVAEQLEDVGLGCLVEYDSENKDIAGVAYDRIPIMYIPLIKDLYNQVDELKAEIQTLKGETGK